MSLFGSAAIVVGVHGGALSNVIACDEGTRLIELGLGELLFTSFSSLLHFYGSKTASVINRFYWLN